MTQDIFIRCQKFTYDKVWQNMFYNCSLGKFPPGVVLNSGVLKFKDKSIQVVNNDDKTCMEIIGFMKGVFIPPREEDGATSAMNTLGVTTATTKTLEWKNIKKEMRERMIADYITRFAKNNNLSKSDVKTAESTIYLGFQMGTLTNDNIIIEKGCDFISNIEGFECEIVDGIKTFTTPTIKNINNGSVVVNNTFRNKYLNCMEKYIRNQNNRSIFQ